MQKEKILNLAAKQNGLIHAQDLRPLKINTKILQRLTEDGNLERISRGVYIDANTFEDTYALAQYRCPKGIFSHETALFLHDLSDRVPFQLMLTIPTGSSTRLARNKTDYRIFYIKKTWHTLGRMTMESPFGNPIQVYNKERTLCDCIRKKEILDTDLVITAIKRYIKGKETDYVRLLDYAKVFKIQDQVKNYLEVLV